MGKLLARIIDWLAGNDEQGLAKRLLVRPAHHTAEVMMRLVDGLAEYRDAPA